MRRRGAGFRKGFLRARDGAAAVEFALVVFPLTFMLFAIMEVALYFTIDSVLDNAVVETSRLVRTGQASAQGMTAAQFKTRLCERMSIFSSGCEAKTIVDVRVIPQFSAVPADPISNGSFNQSQANNYTNGNPGDLVLVRVWYSQPLMTTFLSQGLSRLNDGKILLTATTAFRNEPA